MIPYPLTRRIIFALAILGVLVTGYLSVEHIFGGPIICATGHGCDIVRASVYAKFMGIPIAVFGLGMYLVLIAFLLSNRRALTSLNVLMSGIGVAYSLYLTYLELYVIHAICSWCVAQAVLVTLIFVVYLISQKPKELL